MSMKKRITEIKTKRYCAHSNCDVVLKTTYVYPSDIMPDSAPRINQRTCSHYFTCSLQDKSACTFAVEKINSPNNQVDYSKI